ncbi:aspartyl protease family protein [Providencia rettgeri]|nr:aspartyl protease family protein [Providencia rettgeri]
MTPRLFISKKTILVVTLLLSGCVNLPKKNAPILVHSFKNQYVEYILVPVLIKGKKYTFMLDTGSSSSIIDKNLASKLTTNMNKLPKLYYKYFNTVNTVSGQKKLEEINFVHPIPFSIGTKYFDGGEFWVTDDLSLLSQATGENISGILGVDIFRQLNWEIDRKNKILTIYDNPPPISEYQQCSPYDDYTFGSPYFRTYFDDDIYVSTKLDTGSSSNYISNELIEYINNNKTNAVLEPVESFNNNISIEFSGIVKNNNKNYKIKQFQFNNSDFYDKEFHITNNDSYAIGMSTLESFDKYLLSPNKMLFCYNMATTQKINLKNTRNINFRSYNNQIEIFYNNEKVTSEFSLKNGDILISINGIKYPANAVTKVKKLIDTLPKGQVELVINRQGKLINIHF